MLRRHEVDITLVSFLLLSLLLHFVFLAVTGKVELTQQQEQKPEPVVVEMFEQTDAGEREQSPNTAPEIDTPNLTAERRGDTNRLAPIEKAPVGDDIEDVAPPAAVDAKPQPVKSSDVVKDFEIDLPKSQSGSDEYTIPKSADGEGTKSLPTLTQLYQVPKETRERLSEEVVRSKYRESVDDADAVWLNTKTDVLFSFFRRFKDNIYLSWNYPVEAARRHESGECLLKIEISRKGVVSKIDLVESTGYERLDNEAISAVWKGSPFGPLPEAFQKDVLKLYVVFQYNLKSQAVF